MGKNLKCSTKDSNKRDAESARTKNSVVNLITFHLM